MQKNNHNRRGGYVILMNNNVLVRCCGRGRKRITSEKRHIWWGWLVSGTWCTKFAIFSLYSVDNLYRRVYLVRKKKQPWFYIHRMICGLYRGSSCCWLHIKYKHKICGLVTLCYYFFPLYRMIEASKVDHSAKLRSRLLVTASGSLRFGSQHPAPRRIRSRGHPFRIAAINKKVLVRNIRTKRTRFETFGGKETEYRKVTWR